MNKYRILLVDDDDDARRILAIGLRHRYEVVEARDGLDALSKLETFEPDFAIIDIMMPLMDGYQLCEAIRRHPRFKTMQVLFLSAFGSKENVKKGYAVGANLFMTKPVDPDRVLKNIDFTTQHDPPPLRHKKYTIEQLQQIENQQTTKPEAPAVQAPDPQAPRPQAAAPPPPPPRPAAPPSPPAQPAAPAESSHQGAPQVRILVVDDDPEMLQMVDLALRDEYEITTASNGLEAIERLVDYEPDILLLDIMMPKMNGYQLLQSIRRNAYFKALPVIVISAKSTPKDRDYAARLGATSFIGKPYHIDELLNVLQAVTSSPQFRQTAKSLSINEIRERVLNQARDRHDRNQEMFAQRKREEMQKIINEDRGH